MTKLHHGETIELQLQIIAGATEELSRECKSILQAEEPRLGALEDILTQINLLVSMKQNLRYLLKQVPINIKHSDEIRAKIVNELKARL